MKNILLIPFIAICLSSYGQQDIIIKVERWDKSMITSLQKKDYKQFLLFGDSILTLVPANKKVLLGCYQAAVAGLRDTTKAMNYLVQAIKAYPYESDLLSDYGWLALLKNMPEAALAACSDAYVLNRYSIPAVLNYAHAFYITGDKVNADIAYAEAMHLISTRKEFEQYHIADIELLNKLYPKAGFNKLIKEQLAEADTVLNLYNLANRTAIEVDSLISSDARAEAVIKKLNEAIREEQVFIPRRAKRLSNFYGRLALFENNSGLINNALLHYDTAILYASASSDFESMARNYFNKANLYKNSGQIKIAYDTYIQAGSYYILLNHQLKLAECRLAFAEIGALTGQHDKVIIYLKDSVLPALFKYNESQLIIGAYTFLAQNFNDIKQPDSERIYLQKAIDLARINLLPESELYSVYSSLAALELSTGNLKAAKDILLKNESLIPGGERKTVSRITANTNIGYCYFKMNLFDSAAFYFQHAVDILIAIRKSLSNEAKLDFVSSQAGPFSYLAASLVHLKNYEGAFKTIEQSKTLLLADKMGAGTFEFPSIENLQRSMSEDQVYYVSAFTNQSGLSERKIIMVIDKNNVQAKIISDSIFLENATKTTFGPYLDTILTRLKRTWTQQETTSLKTKEFMLFSLYMQLQLEKAAGQARGVDEVNEINDKTSAASYAKSVGKILYHELLTPFEQMLKNKKEIIVLADGFLSFVPFETLIDETEKYLIEKINVSYLPSIRIGNFLQERQKAYKGKKGVLIGDPVFTKLSATDLEVGVRSAYLSAKAINWTGLPGTGKEMETIGRLFKNNLALSKTDCTEERVKDLFSAASETYTFIHFATHGYVMNGDAEKSAIILNQLPGTKEDGYLTAREIESLKIPADIVVLSACQTGKGVIAEGEGVQGLSSSFFVAGANALVVSMWSVSDNSTQIFMENVYRLVKEKNIGFKMAIQQVKKRFLDGEFGNEYQKPYYWAPFIYIGN